MQLKWAHCTSFVYTKSVSTLKNITFSAPAEAIEKARTRAGLEHTTLNDVFREWLAHYGGKKLSGSEFRKFMDELRYVDAGRKFTREEMNQRGGSR
jgi:hypothetical protein